MVKTRAMRNRNPSKTVRRIYRKRVKKSKCRGKGPAVCRSKKTCKYVSTRKRNYCRKKSNKERLARILGRGRRN
jgi:hypothetical protein